MLNVEDAYKLPTLFSKKESDTVTHVRFLFAQSNAIREV